MLPGLRSAPLRDDGCRRVTVRRGAPCTPSGCSHLSWSFQRMASLLVPNRLRGHSLNGQRKVGSVNQFSEIFNTCFAHVLICTNLLSLPKGPFLPWAPGRVSESLSFCRPQAPPWAPGSGVHLGLVAWFPSLPGWVGSAGPRQAQEARWNSLGAGNRKLFFGGGGPTGSHVGLQAHCAFLGDWVFLVGCEVPSWWTAVFLLQGLHDRRALTEL